MNALGGRCMTSKPCLKSKTSFNNEILPQEEITLAHVRVYLSDPLCSLTCQLMRRDALSRSFLGSDPEEITLKNTTRKLYFFAETKSER